VVTSLRDCNADLFPGCLRLTHINRPADREVLTLDFLHVSHNILQSLEENPRLRLHEGGNCGGHGGFIKVKSINGSMIRPKQAERRR